MSDRKRKCQFVHNRIMTAMSCIDVLNSLAWFASTAAIPLGSEYTYGAQGTTATCAAQGFFIQLGLAVPVYNAMMCIYFYLVVKSKIDMATIEKKIEPLMHGIALFYPLLTAIASVSMGLFNNKAVVCWISPYPFDCSIRADIKCTRGHNAGFYSIVFCAVEMILVFLVICFSMIKIVLHVHGRGNTMKRYQFRGSEMPARFSEQSKETTKQAFLYVVAYFITYIFPGINVVVTFLYGNTTSVSINVLASILAPLQGFWNISNAKPISCKHSASYLL